LSFFAELKRRNVFRVGIAYGIATWALLQITDVITPILELPEWAPKLIFVFLAVGLVPALIFAWAFEMTPEGLKKEKDVDRTQSITRDTGRKLNFAIIGILVIAVGLLLVERSSREETPTVADEVEKSIAVLPFVNMSSDAEQEFFSDGITEEILNSLAAVKELKVAGRTSSFAFKGKNDDLRTIGDTLGVEHILEGSVRKSGTTVRITAQLIQVEDGFHMWSDTYDRELTDIFAIQDEIATEILKQLKAQLLDEELEVLVARRTDPKVYDLYLQAKQRMYTRTGPTIESARALLDEAIALDREYAPAFAQRAIATLLLSKRSYGSIPELEATRQARRFIDTALKLDPQLAEGWAALGLYHNSRAAEHEQAIEALSKALSLNPNLIDASNWLQIAVGESGDPRAAMLILEDMIEKDPLYKPAFGNAMNAFNVFGQAEKADALIEKFRTFYPNDAQIMRADAMVHFFRGESARGLQLAEQALEISPANAVVQFTYSVGLIMTGQTERLATEGIDFTRVFALETIGRRDEAFQLAFSLAGEGYIGNLFGLFNETDRSHDLVNYLEERWPGLDEFAADYPHDNFGYDLMTDVAYAYAKTGNQQRFDDAMALVESAVTTLSEQGVDNFVNNRQNARYFVLAGQNDAALEQLSKAVDSGMRNGERLESDVVFTTLWDDPRYQALHEEMIAKTNEQRQLLDLPAIEFETRL